MLHVPAWPLLSDRGQELLRRGAQVALDPDAQWVEQVHAATLSGERMRPVADNPVLAAAVRRTNLANLLQWATANVQHPGRRVVPELDADALEAARDLVRRGLDESALDAYRTGQAVAWRRWMQICFGLTDDPAELRELLDVSALSIATFLDDLIAEVSGRMAAERAELTRGDSAERRATVTLLLEGAPISRARAEAQLAYRLTGPHTAAVVWSTAAGSAAALESAAAALVRASGAGSRLTVVASAATLWIWLPVAGRLPDLPELPDVRVAVGRPGTDAAGFRRSHLDAVATQRMLARTGSAQQVAHYDDVQLAALLTADPALAQEFLADTLGDLLTADPQTRAAVLAYVQELGSTTRTARRLFTHRNTVLRRLARADELLPRPLADNVVAVATALEVLRWRGRP